MRRSTLSLWLITLGYVAIASSSASWASQRLSFVEVYEQPYDAKTAVFAQFADQHGTVLVLAQPIEPDSKGPEKGWELRTIDLAQGKTLARRSFENATEVNCGTHEPIWHGPRLEVVGAGGKRRVVFHWCGKSEFLDPTDLTTQRATARIWGALSPSGDLAVTLDVKTRIGLTGSLRSLETGTQICAVSAMHPPEGMEAEVSDVLFSPDEHYIAILTYAGVRPEGFGLSVQRRGLRVYEARECNILSSHWFAGRVGEGPDRTAKFAGKQSQWLVATHSWKKDGFVHVWDWRTGKKIREYEFRAGRDLVKLLDVSHDGRFVAASTGHEPTRRSLRDFVIWDLEAERIVYQSPKYSLRREADKWSPSYIPPDGKHPAATLSYYLDPSVRFSSDSRRLLYVGANKISVLERTTEGR